MILLSHWILGDKLWKFWNSAYLGKLVIQNCLFKVFFAFIAFLKMKTINKTTNYYLISISSYSRLYSGIVDFLKCKIYTRKMYIFFLQSPKRQHSSIWYRMNQQEHEKCEFWTKMMNSLQELVVYPAPTHLKFASLANSKHILTGQKNSALTSLQCSRLATENQNLWKLAPTWLRHCNHNSEIPK